MVAKGIRTIDYPDDDTSKDPVVTWTQIHNCPECPLVGTKTLSHGSTNGKPPVIINHCMHNRLITQQVVGIIETTRVPEQGTRDDCPLPVIPEEGSSK